MHDVHGHGPTAPIVYGAHWALIHMWQCHDGRQFQRRTTPNPEVNFLRNPNPMPYPSAICPPGASDGREGLHPVFGEGA